MTLQYRVLPRQTWMPPTDYRQWVTMLQGFVNENSWLSADAFDQTPLSYPKKIIPGVQTEIQNELGQELHCHLAFNERSFDRFVPFLGKRGGVYLGVGALQNYTLMQGHDAAVFCDYDPLIKIFHEFILGKINDFERRDDFVDFLKNEAQQLGFEFLKRHSPHEFPDDFLYHEIGLAFYLQIQAMESSRSFLVSQESYQALRTMVVSGRVFTLCDDLFSPRTLERIQRSFGIDPKDIASVYLSNALKYSPRGDDVFSFLKRLSSPNTRFAIVSENESIARSKSGDNDQTERYAWDYWLTVGDRFFSIADDYQNSGVSPLEIDPVGEPEDFVYLGNEWLLEPIY